MRRWERKNLEALGHIGLQPGAELRGFLRILVDGLAQAALGFYPIHGFKDGAQVRRHLAAPLQARHIVCSVLLQMETEVTLKIRIP